MEPAQPDLTLKQRLLDPRRAVLLYGTTPPRGGTPDDTVRTVAGKLAIRLGGMPVDGVVVYDIQDESGRTHIPRPFPFTGTIDPRDYSQILARQTGRAALTYKCVADLDAATWLAWLTDTAGRYGAGCLSIVGRPTSGVRYPLSLLDAIRLASAHPAGFTVGGVVIAERHDDERSESARLLAKIAHGCSYFISQTVYHAEATERLLADYARDCRRAGVQPRRIVLTFAPAGREKTMAFLKWLGVRIPAETQADILGSTDPIGKSIEVCRDNLRKILGHDYARELPLGINVESVSINRDEIEASIELFRVLAAVMGERG